MGGGLCERAESENSFSTWNNSNVAKEPDPGNPLFRGKIQAVLSITPFEGRIGNAALQIAEFSATSAVAATTDRSRFQETFSC